MADLYEACQSAFERVQRHRLLAPGPHVADPDRIAALRALKDRLQATGGAIEAALFDLQNGGRTNAGLSHALAIANHCAAGAAQLLVAALDGQEDIRAAIDDMKRTTTALEAIKTDTQDLIDRLDHVTGVLTTAGTVLELIKA